MTPPTGWNMSCAKNVVYGKGSDAQVAAATILQHFQQHGFMCSLDRPNVLIWLGLTLVNNFWRLPGVVLACQLCAKKMWSKHVRWPSCKGFLGSDPFNTKGLSIPQSGPPGPCWSEIRWGNRSGLLTVNCNIYGWPNIFHLWCISSASST